MFMILGDPLPLAIKNINESPKVNDPCNAVLYIGGPITYIHDLSIENNASPIK
jgi:hypothetical protein